MSEQLQPIKAALERLAAVCDYAQEEDGAGFNKPDAGIGHRLAVLPVDLWTPEEARDAWKRLRKYRAQLEGFGVHYDELQEPALEARPIDYRRRVGIIRGVEKKGASLSAGDKLEAARMEQETLEQRRRDAEIAGRRVTLEGAGLRVRFPYNPDVVAAFKAIPGRKRFDGATKTWLLELAGVGVKALQTFLETYRFELDVEAELKVDELYRDLVEGRIQDAPAVAPLAKKVDFDAPSDGLTVAFEYDAGLVDAFKRGVPASRFSKADRVWLVPARLGSIEGLVRFAETHGFEITGAAMTKIREVVDHHRGQIEASRAASAELEALPLEGKLAAGLAPRPFQVAGVLYALKAKKVIFGDEMGLGKTIQALLTALCADAFPLVVVCPASLIYNWYNEARKWLRGKTISVLRSGVPGAYHADVIIINYDILTERRKPGDPKPPKPEKGKKKEVPLSYHAREILKRNARTIVFDEIHYLKTYNALRTLACEALAKGVEYRLGLTGTLFLNRPSEGIAPLSILGRLNDVGGFWYYATRYCGGHKTRFGLDLSGAQNLNELNERLRATCYIRREKSDVLKELPAKTRQTIQLSIDNRAEYDRAEGNLVAWLQEHAREDKVFLEELDNRLARHRADLGLASDEELAGKAGLETPLDATGRQVAIDHLVMIERDLRIRERQDDVARQARKAEQLVKLEALKQLAARGKLAGVVEWVSSFVEEQKLILFARHIEIQKALIAAAEAAKIKTVHLLGEDSAEARQAAVDAFQEDPSVRLVVASLDAAGVGWTGTAASNVAFVELGWTPAIHDQAEDRAHRIGQHDAVTAWYLTARGTVEDDIVSLIETKRAVVTAATVGDKGLLGTRTSVALETIGRLLARGAGGRREEEELVF